MATKPADRTAEAKQITLKEFLKADLSSRYGKPDKMHLYVNGSHKLSIDADKAHAVAQTYMSQGDSVWLSRKVVRFE